MDALRLIIRGLYLENGNRDQNLVYKRQWGHCVLPRYTSSILGLCYAIQVSMERRRNGGGKGEGGERCVDVLGMHGEVEEEPRPMKCLCLGLSSDTSFYWTS